MTIEQLFATSVYSAPLQARGQAPFNARLLRECRQLRLDDRAGRRWSRSGYPGGYTSYGSAHQMHLSSPTFAELQRLLRRHVGRFARTLAWDVKRRPLEMTDCWVNIMPRGVAHGMHLHPLSALSGTYYVQIPPGSPALKLEDPRLDRMMAAPPRRRGARRDIQPWVLVPARSGWIVLFESWLRHEVAPNAARADRISISFNYSWF
jgi:uncharacterized protein (TIGR02466 family)